MKLLSLKQTSCRETDVVFRNSALASAITTIVMLGLVIGAAYLVVYGRIISFDSPRIVTAAAGLFFLFFVWVAGNSWMATRRPTNWIMRIRGNEVLIKFRSYQNWRLPEDETQVIELRRDEIAFVRQLKQRQMTRNTDGGVQVNRQANLEIGLKNIDATALENALAAEISRPGWGNDHHRTKILDYPVSQENGVIRIAWSTGSGSVRPRIKRALKELGRLAEVATAQTGMDDFTPTALKKLSDEEQKTKLKELARKDRIAAVQTARNIYGCSLGEANQMIEELTSLAGQDASDQVCKKP